MPYYTLLQNVSSTVRVYIWEEKLQGDQMFSKWGGPLLLKLQDISIYSKCFYVITFKSFFPCLKCLIIIYIEQQILE